MGEKGGREGMGEKVGDSEVEESREKRRGEIGQRERRDKWEG